MVTPRQHVRHLPALAAPLCAALCTALCAAVLSTACAAGVRSSYSATAAGAPSVRPLDLRTLDTQALRAQHHDLVLDAVYARWPAIRNPPYESRSRVLADNEPVGVYAHDMFLGGLDMLRDVRVDEVARVRRLTPTEESLRFGRMHRGGALVLEWQRARR